MCGFLVLRQFEAYQSYDPLPKGWRPGSAPLGYLNTKTEIRGENYIIKDPKRFSVIRGAWDFMLTGNFTADQILKKLNKKGFLTREGKRRGSKPMSRSTIYRIFTSPFYAGMMDYRVGGRKGKDDVEPLLSPGKHEAMVTLEEYDSVQLLLGRKGKPRPSERHEYAFTGVIRCGECGSLISGTSKQKFIKKTKQLKAYVLYYCIRASKFKEKCSQNHYTNLNNIEDQIVDKISCFAIWPEFQNWALNVLNDQDDKEFEEHNKTIENHKGAVESAERQLSNLTHMRMLDQVDDEEYERERTRLKNHITTLNTNVSQIDMEKESWISLTKKAFVFASNASRAFAGGSAEAKRDILTTISLNWTLKDHKLNFQAQEWLMPFINQNPKSSTQKEPLEPTKIGLFTREKAAEAALNPEMRGRWDLNPRSPP